jgi:hypothetical protein
MQNREELRQKERNKRKKRQGGAQEGEKYHFQKGGG